MYLFNDKADVAIFFGIGLMYFTELFYGVIRVEGYNNKANKNWYDTIAEKIRGMPPTWLYPIVWTCLFLLIWFGTYDYYRGESYPNSTYLIDTITVLFLVNTLLIKMWSYVFFTLRQTIVSCIMIFLIWSISLTISVLFGINSVIFGCVSYALLTAWCTYAFYLNIMWIIVEKSALLQ